VLEHGVLRGVGERQVGRPAGAARIVDEPLATVTIGWNGGWPPSSVESFSVTRLWKTPPLVRSTVLSFSL
jgi:hypothetical protein